MREIKFRAWNKTRNEMLKDLLVADKCVIQRYHDMNGQICFRTLETYYDARMDFVPLQYSGLKIKDKEIYECDIIKARKDFIYKVIFENGSFVLYHLNKFAGKENLRWGLLSRFFETDMQDILKECEVIGNIYENPELLKED